MRHIAGREPELPAGAPAPPPHGRVRPRASTGSRLVGFVGELFITAGVFLGLFVVWQLWWTDVQAGRLHQEILAGLEWEAPPAQVEASGDEPGPLVAPEYRDDWPVEPQPEHAEIFAQIYVPRWGADYVTPVAEGIDKAEILDRLGVGHYPGTAMPGELGNFATAGHRTTYGQPYHRVHELQEGDPIVVRTEDNWYVYRVTGDEIVWPHQVEVVSPIPGLMPGEPVPELTERFITLTACHPIYSAAQRFIVYGEADYWAPVSEGTPIELLEAGVQVTAEGVADDGDEVA